MLAVHERGSLLRPRVMRALVALCLVAAAGCGGDRRDASAPAGNLARGGTVTATEAMADPAAVIDGRILPEAAPSLSEGAVPLGSVADSVVVDLGAPRPVGALLLQADSADVYFVELSPDAAGWYVAWRVEPLVGATGLHTRHAALPRPLAARFVRVRSTTARSAAVSEIQAYAAEPPAWPALDRSARQAHRPLWPALTRERTATLFGALAALFLAVAAWNAAADPSRDARRRRTARGALAAVAAAALLAWPNFMNFHYFGFVHTWEFFHYYMGAKYLPELGYTCLYTAAAAVDAEDGLDLRGRTMRDLRDNRLVPAESALQRAPECRARFSDGRWSGFRDDARFFRGAMGHEEWLGVRSDHGFNGTPAWAVLGRLLTALGSASWAQVISLALLDVVLVLAIFALLWRGFGLEAACIAAGFWGVNTLAPFGWTGGGFLRYDWLLALIAGITALRAGRPGAAGFALGYAALLRIFPGCAIAGLAVTAVAEAASARSLEPLRRRARLAAGVAAALVLVGGASVLMAGRAGIWAEFAANSAKHLATPSSNLVGLEPLLTYEPEGRLELMTDPLLLDRHAAWKARLAEASHRTRPSRWLAAALFALLLAMAARGVPEWAAAVLALGLMPLLFALSSYYYCALVAFAALLTLRRGVGVALAGLAWITTVISGLWPDPDARHAALSLAVVAFVTGVAGVFAWRARDLVRAAGAMDATAAVRDNAP